MQRKKFLSFLVFTLLCLTFVLLLTLHSGAETVTVTDTNELKTALTTAVSGDTIRLGGDISLTEEIAINRSLTIEGNGNTLHTSGSRAFVVTADLTLQNIVINGNGSCRLLNVPAGSSPTLTISGNTTLSAGAELPIYSEGSPEVVLNGNTAGNGVSFSGNHGMYFVGGTPQITVSGKVAMDVVKCGIYAVNTTGAVITIDGTAVTVTGGETGIYIENAVTPTAAATVSLAGTLTMNMGKYGVESKNYASIQLTTSGTVTINANYCLVSSSYNAFHMDVAGNTVLNPNKNPIHFNEFAGPTHNIRVAGDAKLSGQQIITTGACVALTIAERAEVTLTEIELNSSASSLTVTDNAKVTCSKNIRFVPGASKTQSFVASGNAIITTKGELPYFGIHFTGAGNGTVQISGNATVTTAVHTTVAQNTGTYSFEMTGGTLHSAQHSCVWTGDTTVATVTLQGGTLLSDNNYTMELKGKAGSTFSICGGTIISQKGLAAIEPNDTVTVNIYGGSIIAKKGETAITAKSSVTVNIYGGSVIAETAHAAVEARNSSTVNIYGGYFEGNQKCCARSRESATLNVYGGYFYYAGVETSDGSTVRAGVAADTQSPTVNLYGGTFISTSTHGAIFNAIAPNGTFNIAESAVFSCQGGNAILIRSSGASVFYEGAAHRYSSAAAPAMTYGAQVRLVEGSTGLRFATEYPKAAVDYFTAMADAGTLTFGTLIIPTDYLDQLPRFTLDALIDADLTYLNLKAENGLIQNSDGSITVRAAITNIKPENLNRDFTAIGYACYKKEGTLIYFYANHRKLDHSRSICRVAQLALEDVSATKEGKYQYAVGDGTYSRYSKTQRDYMTASFYNPATAEKKTIDLYLIAGQSNAAGYSYFNESFLQSNATYATGYENVLYSGSAVGMVTNVPLSPNRIDVTPVRPGFGQLDTYIGPELGIADLLSQYYTDPNHKAGIIKYAVGSSRLRDDIAGVSALGGNWYPPSLIAQNGALSERLTGNLYRMFIDQVENSIQDFRALGYEIHIKGVYWMQGESDRDYVSIYPDLLRALIADMRNDLGELSGENLSSMPFVVGQISSSFFRDRNNSNTSFVAMQQQLPTLLADVGNVHVIHSSPLSTGTNSGDAGHWTAEDMLLIGQMAGATFAKAVLGESPTDPCKNGAPVAEIFNAAGQSLGSYSHFAYAINIAPAGATVKLLCNLTLHSALNISNENAITVDGNGYTLTSRSSDHAVRIVSGDVTAENLRVVHTVDSGSVYGFFLYDSAKLTFNSGYVEASEYCFCLNQEGIQLIINGGTFKTRKGANETVCALVVGKAATVTVNGGSFDVAANASCISIRAGYGGTVTVNGGSFKTASGKYCIHNPDTTATLSIPNKNALTFEGATVSDIANSGLGYAG